MLVKGTRPLTGACPVETKATATGQLYRVPRRTGRTYISNLTYNTMNNDIRQARAAIIATLNDEFRTTGQGGEVVTTRGVESLGTKQVARIEQLVRDFTDFTAEDDPHGEHDCGSFEYNGQFIYWKIDYYD